MHKKNMSEKNTMDKTAKQKTGVFSSIKTKVTSVLTGAIIITITLGISVIIPNVNRNITAINQSYMKDITNAYGRILDQNISISVMYLYVDRLENLLGDVGIEGVESSYFYVVAADGTMLYHPTTEKIGQPVENAVISGVVEELAEGNIPEPKLVEYDYHGVKKYASYYIAGEGKAILVLSADEAEMLETTTRIAIQAVVLCLLGGIVLVILGYIIVARMTKPIITITNIVEKLAHMDFREDPRMARINQRKDETGTMGRAIASLRLALVDVVSDLKEQSSRLYTTSEQLSSSASETSNTVQNVERAVSEIATGATSQAEETQRATEDILLMGTMVEDTTSQVSSLHSTADSMKISSDTASSTLQELDSINQRAIDSINVIYEQTHTTNESALKIKDAANLIANIAEETNLLALNASIEAARAGDAGRGFAVVASQIQNLAEQSNDSAQRIDTIIYELLEDSQKAVKTMEEVKQIMSQQSENVTKTGSVFSQVQGGISDSLMGVAEIADRTTQLDSARVNIVDVVQSLTAIAEENAASTQETSAAVMEVANVMQEISNYANHLQEIASTLEKNIDIFKL